MQEVLTYKPVSNERIKELVSEQYPELIYLFEKQPRGLSVKEKAYRKFLKEQLLNNLKIKV